MKRIVFAVLAILATVSLASAGSITLAPITLANTNTNFTNSSAFTVSQFNCAGCTLTSIDFSLALTETSNYTATGTVGDTFGYLASVKEILTDPSVLMSLTGQGSATD